MSEFLQSLVPQIEHFKILSYWIVFIAAFFESLVLIGLFFPGTLIVVFAGFLVTQQVFDFGDLIWFAVLGAVLGDQLSFYLGKNKSAFLINRFKDKTILNARKYFNNHGGKSIVFGRFFGPFRAFIPFVAGTMKMKQLYFSVLNVISAILWALCYISLGYFFGTAWKAVEIWTSRVGFILSGLIVLIIISSFLFKKIKITSFEIQSIFKDFKKILSENIKVKKWLKKHMKAMAFINDRFNKHKFTGLTLTMLGVSFIYVLALFLGIIEDFISSEQITHADQNIAHITPYFRSLYLTNFFEWVTILADPKVLVVVSLASLILLFIWNKRNVIPGLLLSLISSGALVFIGKDFFVRPRPNTAIVLETSYSFPSGHSTMAVALYGFIIYLIWKSKFKQKNKLLVSFILLLIIGLIGISRIYLGVHYISDVWGGFLLGTLCLLLSISISEYFLTKKTKRTKEIPRPTFISILVGILTYYLIETPLNKYIKSKAYKNV